jgi:pyrroline-5-carboxylate reductase
MSPDAASPKLLLVGCGQMGGALLKGIAGQAETCVVDPAAPHHTLEALPNVSWLTALDKIDPAFDPDIIILAIKPQYMASVLPDYARYTRSVFLSIAAGTPIGVIETLLKNQNHAVVRSMPNLPASIGQGMSVAVANKNVSPAQRMLCDRFLKAVGSVAWVDDEDQLDAVTALSGSGPAYVFALCESMAKSGEALGLSAALAQQLARQTVIGSGALLVQSSETAEALRRSVTSPGGTTEAALKSLLAEDGLPSLMLKAMRAAMQRAKELARLA